MTDVLQLLGSLGITVFALMLFKVALGHWWCRYGKEALLCSATYHLCVVGVRVADTLDWLSPTSARTVNGYVVWVFVGLLAHIVWFHWYSDRITKRIQGGRTT